MLRYVMISILFSMLLTAFPLSSLEAGISCDQTTLQNAINVAVDGATIACDEGSWTWNSPITIDLSSGKALTVQGAGIGRTNITHGRFNIVGASNKDWRISGMTLKGSAGISVGGQSKSWRIDNIYFDHATGYTQGRIVWVQPTGSYSAYTSGVIDHCTFDNPSVIAFHYRDTQASGGNSAWNRSLGLGGSDAVYIEDCTFMFDRFNASAPVTDCEGGSFVFRHNTLRNAYLEMHDAIVVGWRGCRKWEIYENTFNNDAGSGICTNIHLRSGTGVVFNNTINGKPDCDNGIQMVLYRTYQTGGDPWNSLCSNSSGKACLTSSGTYPKKCGSDADCGGSAGSCVSIDNPADSIGHPCRDQVGWYGNANRTSSPALFWNNKVNGVFFEPRIASGENYYTKGVDYCSNASATKPSACNGIVTNYNPYPYPFKGGQDQGTIGVPKNLKLVQ